MDIKALLKQSVELNASDLHISPTLKPQARIYGELRELDSSLGIVTPEAAKDLAYQAMTEDQQIEFEKELHVEFAWHLPDIGLFRASIYNQRNGISCVFRVITEDVPSFESLSLPPQFKRLLGLNSGLIILCGPTGCGKSTTMAAMLDFINRNRACNIITIEDPIEYVHQNKKAMVNQLQVGKDTHSYQIALRAALRQDPDVIMVGEMRDLETIRLVLAAADTGHLVITTLHSRSAAQAINRVVDVFPSEEKNRVRNMLAEGIESIIYQTLLKGAKGGRVAAFEILMSTPGIRHLIHTEHMTQIESAIQTGSEHGMCTLEQYIEKLVAKKFITKSVATTFKKKTSTKE